METTQQTIEQPVQQDKIKQTVSSATSTVIKYSVRTLFTIGKVAGQTACAIASGAKEGYQQASKELSKNNAPW